MLDLGEIARTKTNQSILFMGKQAMVCACVFVEWFLSFLNIIADLQ